MKLIICAAAAVGVLAGCTSFNGLLCAPHCRAETRNSSSLVSFLYPNGEMPPAQDVVPELHLPLRVGLAFLPAQSPGNYADLDDAHKSRSSSAFENALPIGNSSAKSSSFPIIS